MFHAAELEAGDEDEVEFAEGVGLGGVVFEPGEGLGVEVEDGFAVGGDEGGVGFTVEEAELSAVAFGFFDLEFTGGEGEEVGGDGLGLASVLSIPDVGPAGGEVHVEAEAGFEVGLVKAGEGGGGAVGDEEGVEEVGLAIEGEVAGEETDGEVEGAGGELGDDDVFFTDCVGDGGAGEEDGGDGVLGVGEVEDDVAAGGSELDVDFAGDALAVVGGDLEAEVVVEVADLPGAGLGEGLADAGSDKSGGRGLQHCIQK